MGLEFLRDHGGRRVRQYQDQLVLDQPDEPGDDGSDPDEVQVDHGIECGPESWKPIAVTSAAVDWDEAPRRFIDGCHVGHTVAWLQDAEGHPIPLMLAEIGGVCVAREGRELRRAFHVVERVVALVIDPFPWNEVEDFAIALTGSGFRLLLARPPGDERGDAAPSYDFEVMRKRTQNRSNYEMEVLEEVALCQDAEVPTVVDGRLEPRISGHGGLSRCPLVGVIKQQRKSYLHPRGWKVYYYLEPGQRTPAFLLTSGTEKKILPVVSWYLKLDGALGTLPNWGVVRVEITREYFQRIGDDFRQIDRLSHALYELRYRLGDYGRGPVSLAPIVRAEEYLKALFASPSWLSQRFYHLTGL